MVLLPQPTRSRGVQQQLVRALLRPPTWGSARNSATTFLLTADPALAAVIGAKHAGRGDGDVHAPSVAGVELDRMAAHPSGARKPLLARRVLQDAAIDLPGLPTVVRAKQHARVGPQIERPWLLRPARLDVPDGVQRQPRLLGQADLLATASRSCRRSSSVGRSGRRRGGSSRRTSCRHAGPVSRGTRPSPRAAGPRPATGGGRRRRAAGTAPCSCRRAPGRRSLDLDLAGVKPAPCAAGAADHGQLVRPTRPLRHSPRVRCGVTHIGGRARGNGTNQHLVRSIIHLARGLYKQTIAEGIESEEALAPPRSFGVDYGQGFHLGGPEPVEAAPANSQHGQSRHRSPR